MTTEFKNFLHKESRNKQHIADWNSYLYIGFLFSMLLSFLGADKNGSYQVVVVLFFFVLSGMNKNAVYLISYIRRYPLLPVITIIYTVFYFFCRTEPTSNRFPITIFLIIFGGYCTTISCKGNLEKLYGRFWIILSAFILIDIFSIYDNRPLYFQNPMFELGIIVFYALLTCLYIKDSKLRFAGEGLIVILVIFLFRSNEISFSHALKIKEELSAYMDAELIRKLLGTEYLPVETLNTFTEFLLYYGLLAFVLLLSVIVYASYMAIFSKNIELKKQSILVSSTLICSALYSAFSYLTASYMIFVEIGIFLGQIAIIKDKAISSSGTHNKH